jgi:dihydroxyacetone kinase phosphoprotein-dependent L subunit
MVTPPLQAAQARAWVEAFLDAIAAEADALGDLDRRAGDGDFGSNLRAAERRIRAALDRVPADAGAGAPFAAVSSGFLGTGGTSGPLYGMWFRALAQAGGDGPGVELAALAEAVEDGNATIQRLGGAQVGDKTMLDALVPAAAALRAAADAGAAPVEALAAAATAADDGARSTADLVARRGRASYVGEVARGVVDPGAATVALLFTSGTRALRAGEPATTVPQSPERDDA